MTVQLFQITPEELQKAIVNGVKTHLDELKINFQPKEPTEYMTRQEVAEWLKVDVSTVHNWTVKGIIKKYALEGKVFYKRAEVEQSIVAL